MGKEDQDQQDQDNSHSKFRELQAKQVEENILLRAENKQMGPLLEGERKRVTSL